MPALQMLDTASEAFHHLGSRGHLPSYRATELPSVDELRADVEVGAETTSTSFAETCNFSDQTELNKKVPGKENLEFRLFDTVAEAKSYGLAWFTSLHRSESMKFAVTKELGKGNFGTVVEACSDKGELVALKLFNPDPHKFEFGFGEFNNYKAIESLLRTDAEKAAFLSLRKVSSEGHILMDKLAGADLLLTLRARGDLSADEFEKLWSRL